MAHLLTISSHGTSLGRKGTAAEAGVQGEGHLPMRKFSKKGLFRKVRGTSGMSLFFCARAPACTPTHQLNDQQARHFT